MDEEESRSEAEGEGEGEVTWHAMNYSGSIIEAMHGERKAQIMSLSDFGVEQVIITIWDRVQGAPWFAAQPSSQFILSGVSMERAKERALGYLHNPS